MAIGDGNEGIFGILEKVIAGVFELGAKAFSAIGEKMTAMAQSAGDKMIAAVPAMGDILGGGGLSNDGPAKSQEIALAPSQEIQAPSRSEERFSVNMEELGNFSPPSFSAAGKDTSIGIV